MTILCVAASTWKPLFVKMGLVDSRDHSSPMHMNTADRQVFGGSTRVHNSNTDTDTSSRSGRSAPITRTFYYQEKRAGVREDSVTLSSGSSWGDEIV